MDHGHGDKRRVTFQLAALPSLPLVPVPGGEQVEELLIDLSETILLKTTETFNPEENENQVKKSFWEENKMCAKLCLILVCVTLVILGVAVPVHLQQYGGENYQDPMLHSYPNTGDTSGGSDSNPTGGNLIENGHKGHHSDHHEHNKHEGESSDNLGGNADSESSPDVEGHGEENNQEVQAKFHKKLYELDASKNGQASAVPLTEPTSSGSSQNLDSPNGECQDANSKLLQEIITSIATLQSSFNKLENLMQGTAVDEQISKVIEAIQSGNQTLALKHWNLILKYHQATSSSNDKKLGKVMTQIIKDSYAGNVDNVGKIAEFLEVANECGPFEELYQEMQNYGHVFNGNSAIFLLAYKVHKECGESAETFLKLPAAVKAIIGGTFTLQNKFNKGYLYYAKRCVARHHYHCVDVLTKIISPGEFKALDINGDEWGRYHWKINATDCSGKGYYILNQDKFWSYRLQDMNNSPRFRMEEAGSGMDIEMARFQLLLQNENEIKVQVGDVTNVFLEGEESKGVSDMMLHSTFFKSGDAESDKFLWVVKGLEGHGNGGQSGQTGVMGISSISKLRYSISK